MKKQKNILLLTIAIMLISMILPITVKGADDIEWTDFTNAKFEIVPKVKSIASKEVHIDYTIKANNVTLNPESYYWIYFHKKDEEVTANMVKGNFQASFGLGGENESGIITLMEYFLEKKDDIYVSITETQNKGAGKTQLVCKSKKVDRPKLLPELGNRVNIYFGPGNTTTFYWAPHNSKLKRTINIKIGKINDSQILNNIKNNKDNALKDLLNYSKNQNSYNYSGSIEYSNSGLSVTEELTSKMNLEDKAYYFAYIEVDDEGIYYPVEDIEIYQAKGANDLIRFGDDSFAWNNIPEENKNSQNKVNNDKTTNGTNETKKDQTVANNIKI